MDISKMSVRILKTVVLVLLFVTLAYSLCASVGWVGCVDNGCSKYEEGTCQNVGRRPRNICVCTIDH
jgi:hypothetical protein